MSEQQDVSELAREVVQELDPGTSIGEKIILSRRQLIAIAGGGMSLGALATFGAEEATAQSVGSVGTSSERVDVFGSTVDVGSDLVDASGTSHTGELADASELDGDLTPTSVDATNGVTGSTLTATSELVDASGTSHTAELADVSDLDSVSSTSTANGYELTVNGDTYEFVE